MRKKVLIIVGGGVYGCIPAHLLASLPTELQTLDRVDALSGCSIGGILAGAYGLGYDFKFVDNFFQNNADTCFTKRLCAYINPLACPTYADIDISTVLEVLFKNHTMKDTREVYPDLDLFIPTLNLTKDKYKVFDNIDDLDADLKVVTRATSAAPSYFGGVNIDGDCYIDGGVIEVAPLLTAATALRGRRNIRFEDMDVLMIGTGKDVSEKPITPEKYEDMGLLGLATSVIVPYVTLANEMATVYWGNNMGFNSFTYFNPCTHNGYLDDVDQIPDMIKQTDKFVSEFTEVYTEWLTK